MASQQEIDAGLKLLKRQNEAKAHWNQLRKIGAYLKEQKLVVSVETVAELVEYKKKEKK